MIRFTGFNSFLFFIIGWLFTGNIQAQVVTAPLDIGRSVYMSGAGGWYQKSSAAFAYHEGNGDREWGGEQIYEFESSGYNSNVVLSTEFFKLGAFYERNKTDVKLDDRFYPGVINKKYVEYRAFIAIKAQDFATIGLGASSCDSNDYISPNNESEDTKTDGINGSVSFVLLESIYFGLGVEQVNQSTSYTVDNDWVNYSLGMAYFVGSPEGVQFRLEASTTQSQESEKEERGDDQENIHHKTETTRGSIELMMSGLLFSAYAIETRVDEEQKDEDDDLESDQTVITDSGVSVLWIPEQGLSLGFQFSSYKNKQLFEDNINEFSVKLAYVF